MEQIKKSEALSANMPITLPKKKEPSILPLKMAGKWNITDLGNLLQGLLKKKGKKMQI